MESASRQMRFLVEVSAGAHDRNGVPVWLDIPLSEEAAEPGRPQLQREGRQRPIPCELARENGRTRLCWIASGIKAGHTARYRLTFGERKRSLPDRLHVQSTLSGWAVDYWSEPIAEFFLPERGVPRLALRNPTEPLLWIEHRAKPNWLEGGEPVRGAVRPDRTLHRVRRMDSKSTDGVVFSTIRAGYDYLDAMDRVVVAEDYEVRFFAPESSEAVVDYRVRWRATAGGLTLFDPDRSADQRTPTLEARTPAPFGPEVVRSCGAIGPEECERARSADVAVRSTLAWVGMIAQPEVSGAPVVFSVRGEDSVESSLVLPPSRWTPEPVRLALGEELRFGYRFVRMDGAAAKWPERFASFAFAPVVHCRSE